MYWNLSIYQTISVVASGDFDELMEDGAEGEVDGSDLNVDGSDLNVDESDLNAGQYFEEDLNENQDSGEDVTEKVLEQPVLKG